MGLTHAERIEPEVLQRLEIKPYSIVEIAQDLDYNYYSVRKAVRSLEDQALITPVGYHYRNTKYRLSNGTGPNNIIPMIENNGQFKAQEILNLRNIPKPAAVHAIESLPRNMARIFMSAIRLSEGIGSAQLTLQNVRKEMQNDYKSLKAACSIYEQILGNEKFWQDDVLKRYPKDATFNDAEVRSAYSHYYAEE